MDPIFTNALLIDEINKRIAIWDETKNAFHNVEMKRTAWREVVEVFSSPADSIKTRRKMESCLRFKWNKEQRNFTEDVKRTVSVCDGYLQKVRESGFPEEDETKTEDDGASEKELVSDTEWVRRLRKMVLGESDMPDGYVKYGYRRNSVKKVQEDMKRAHVLEWKEEQKQMYKFYEEQEKLQREEQMQQQAQGVPMQPYVPLGFKTYLVPLEVYNGHDPPTHMVYASRMSPQQNNADNLNNKYIPPKPSAPPAEALFTGPKYQPDPLIGGNCGIQYNLYNVPTYTSYLYD